MFPLNAVLFPGVVVPLHIFEDRYRALVRDLLAESSPAERVFGVVAIREGYEVGDHGMQSAHRVGTVVQLTACERFEDGRFDIEVTGRQRMRMDVMHTQGDYFTADVELLEDTEPDDPATRAEAQLEVVRVVEAFDDYRALVGELRGEELVRGRLPADPTYLSYTLAAGCILTLAQRQALLEADSALERLRRLGADLRGEIRAIRALPSLPATELARTRWSPN